MEILQTRKKKFLCIRCIGCYIECCWGCYSNILSQVIVSLTTSNFDKLIFISVIVFGIEILRNFLRFLIHKYSREFYHETLIDLQLSVAKETIEIESKIIDNSTSGIFIDR